ncbi:MAG: molybdopterin molybdotransferase MoeA [Chloroflexi bacterium]|nr:molybdopterin molybdotransferase MoeA [Chloroflexota bacterium]
MVSVEEALDKILGNVEVLEGETRPILECVDRVLAEDVYSPFDVPPLDNSAMDGYALKAEDTRGASEVTPVHLEVIGEVAAGYLPDRDVGPSAAMRIMTGAPLPTGADAVVQFENTSEGRNGTWRKGGWPKRIAIYEEAHIGLNVRKAGEDIAKGVLVLAQGTTLRAAEIGILASLGKAAAPVVRRPVVCILATGDELVDVGQPLPWGKIYNSNSYSTAAAVHRYGGVSTVLGIARDTVEDLREKIDQGLEGDILLTSAGVSTGEYDVVKDVLAEIGEIGFWTVQMKPGKPLAFGVISKGGRKIPHIGLPGNPASAMISFEQFVRPAILKMLGKKKWTKPTVEAILEEDVENQGGRRFFVRAVVEKRNGKYFARMAGSQGSGVLTTMAAANGLAVIPEDVALARAGCLVTVQMLEWLEER